MLLPLEVSSRDKFEAHVNVSRETYQKLEHYEIMLKKWQKAMNLVSRNTLPVVWTRHFLDSAQMLNIFPYKVESLLDIGSGAGFPGMILAILGATNVNLVEPNQKKCLFLREVSRETSTAVTIHNSRIEELPIKCFSVVTARAFAPLTVILEKAKPFLGKKSVGVFPKGASLQKELTTANKQWNMKYSLVQSISDSAGCLVRLEGMVHESRTAR